MMLLVIDIVERVILDDAFAKCERDMRPVVRNVCGWNDNAVARKLCFGKSEVALLCSE